MLYIYNVYILRTLRLLRNLRHCTLVSTMSTTRFIYKKIYAINHTFRSLVTRSFFDVFIHINWYWILWSPYLLPIRCKIKWYSNIDNNTVNSDTRYFAKHKTSNNKWRFYMQGILIWISRVTFPRDKFTVLIVPYSKQL
jgi:hypothetical protein